MKCGDTPIIYTLNLTEFILTERLVQGEDQAILLLSSSNWLILVNCQAPVQVQVGYRSGTGKVKVKKRSVEGQDGQSQSVSG